MDGISVATSVSGLIQLAAKVVNFISTALDAPHTARNVLTQTLALQPIFHQLQDFVLGFSEGDEARKSMIYVDQLIVSLTGCVCTFSELDQVVESLKTYPDSQLYAWGSMKWARKELVLRRIFGSLQQHKSSLGLILAIYTWFVTTSNRLQSKRLG
jgi:hypothetical protein